MTFCSLNSTMTEYRSLMKTTGDLGYIIGLLNNIHTVFKIQAFR